MSNTPRTDALRIHFEDLYSTGTWQEVLPSHCTLERELTAMTKRVAELEAAGQPALKALEGFAYHGRAEGWTEAITAFRAALKEKP